MSDPTLLVLSSLAEGDKHGYAMMQDIEAFAGVRLGLGRSMERLRDWNNMGGFGLCPRQIAASRTRLRRQGGCISRRR